MKGDFGELYIVSVYYRYGYSLEPYLAYMENVLRMTDLWYGCECGLPLVVQQEKEAVAGKTKCVEE